MKRTPLKRNTPLKKTAKDYAPKANGKPRKAPGKATGKSLTRKASILARKACLAEFKHCCAAAGQYGVECAARTPSGGRRWPFLEWCHIKGRGMGGNSRLTFHPENCVALCGAHHVYFTNHPLTFGEFIEEILPGRITKLAELERTLPKGADAKFWAAYYREKGFTTSKDDSAYIGPVID